MLRHYLLMVARSLMRHRLYSLINIAGLAVGLACVTFVVLFVRDELSYDRWIPDTGNLYRLELTLEIPGRAPIQAAVVPYPMPAAMRDQIPGVTGMTRLQPWTVTLTSGNRQFSQSVDVVDAGFFKLIRLPLLRGTPASVFRQPDSIVLSQSAAKEYFGDADPIGQIITAAAGTCDTSGAACPQVSLRVTGIMRDLPHNTQLSGDAFIPWKSLANPIPESQRRNWFIENGYGYVRLAPGLDPARVASAAAPIFDQDVTPVLSRYAGMKVLGSRVYKAHLTPFTQVHLDSRWGFDQKPPGSWSTLYGVAAIGVLTLLVACFNFMNLTTARATLRAREIALRKLVGAGRSQLMLQFLGEAVLMALISLLLALALVEVLLPLFDDFVQQPITLHYMSDWRLLLVLAGIAVATGLISGSYPALVLSGLRPITGLRAGDARSRGSGRLRNVLVVLQFAVSIGMAIAAAVVFRQVSFARAMNLGFHHADVVTISGNSGLTGEKQEAFAQALRAYPGIAAVGLSSYLPFSPAQSMSAVQVPGRPGTFNINTTVIDPDYSTAYGIPLIAGRLLSVDRGADRLNSIGIFTGGDPLNEGRDILVNAAAARQLGFTPQQAVGRSILYNHNHVRIVGVLADAKLQGARQPVVPMIYVYVPSWGMNFSVRLRPGQIPQTLSFIDRTWHAFMPTVAIQRMFLDMSFEQLYREDEREGAMLGVFVAVAVLIGCLGLYGLAVFTAERRTKEIGVRKVSGARTRDILRLMLWRISVPVLVANLLAWPLAYAYLRHWLDGYAFRIPLSPLYFLAGAAVALLIAWITVYGNTLRLARTSPVHALRYE
jgi:putative ABC transport system permease protein